MNAVKKLKAEFLSDAKPNQSAGGGKNQQEIELAEYASTDQARSLCDKAYERYQVGRKATYEALAMTYIWYEINKDNAAYIDEMFQPLANQTNSHVYTKALKVCLRLDENKQAPTISKYKAVLVFINKSLGNKPVLGADKETIKVVASIIADEGGVDACAKAGNTGKSETDDKKHHWTREELSEIARGMLSSKSEVLGRFKPSKGVGIEEDTLAIGLIRAANGKLEVMQITTDEKSVHHLLRSL